MGHYKSWDQVESSFLAAMSAFDTSIASSVGADLNDEEKSELGADLQNGKGDFFNDLLALILEREAMAEAGCRLLMLNSTALLRVAKEILGYTVSEDTFAAVSSVATARSQRWTEEGIAEFFDRLESKRRELADVVVYAAEHGGFIEWSTVYEICGYDENERPLTRFTMPATGIARQMAEEGLLSELASEPIWAEYDGPGKASGFAVPEEFTQFFAE